jgi:hypothetical protein
MITMRLKVAGRLEVQQESCYGATTLDSDVISAFGFDANGGGSKLKQPKSQENGYDLVSNSDVAVLETVAS